MDRNELIEAGARAYFREVSGIDASPLPDGRSPVSDWDYRMARAVLVAVEPLIRADQNERIARAIEAQRMELSGDVASGELWIDGQYVGALTRTDYRMINGVRDMDAAIARAGGGQDA